MIFIACAAEAGTEANVGYGFKVSPDAFQPNPSRSFLGSL